jgi:CHAD domain-containing protein
MLELRDVLTSDRYISLVQDLVQASRTPPYAPGVDVDAPADDPGRRLAARAWKRTARCVRRLGPRPPEVALHEVRRRAKRARYAVELVAPVVGGAKPRQLAKRLSEVQDVLGELQDTVVADQWLRREADDTVPAKEAFAAGLLVHEEADRRRKVRRRWKPEWRRAARPKLRNWMS